MSLPEGETGLRLYPGHIDRGKQAALVAALDAVYRRRTALCAAHAEVGTAVYRAHVELRAAGLGLG